MEKITKDTCAFEELINSNCVYVDKTKYLYELIKDRCAYYFLTRPAGFGKSLSLSAIEAIFRGKRELFKDLYIDSTDYDWKEYPVVHLDFSKLEFSDSDELGEEIKRALLAIADEYHVAVRQDANYNMVLCELFYELAKINKVAALIDNYDYPFISNIDNKDFDAICDVLNTFYLVLKGSSASLRLCLIFSETNFVRSNAYSFMNNFVDISMSDDYASAFGYTEKEIEEGFSEYIERGIEKSGKSREEYMALLKEWYGGYRFSAEGDEVYNPAAIEAFFDNGGISFKAYGSCSNEMASIIRKIAEEVELEAVKISQERINHTDIIQIAKSEVCKYNFNILLYKIGYLTIKNAKIIGYGYLDELGYPNKEAEEILKSIIC